jgi:hypothetical protein
MADIDSADGISTTKNIVLSSLCALVSVFSSCKSYPDRLHPIELPALPEYSQPVMVEESVEVLSGHGGPYMENMSIATEFKNDVPKTPIVRIPSKVLAQPSNILQRSFTFQGRKDFNLQFPKDTTYVVDQTRNVELFRTYHWYGLEKSVRDLIEKDIYKVELREPPQFRIPNEFNENNFDEEYQREMVSRTINAAGRLLKDTIYKNANSIPGANAFIATEKRAKSFLGYFNPLNWLEGNSSVDFDVRSTKDYAIEFGKGNLFIKIGTSSEDGEMVMLCFKN